MKMTILISILLVSCATTKNDFTMQKTAEEESLGIAIGKFKIILNGEDVTKSCNVSFDENFQDHKKKYVFSEGYDLNYKLPKGPNYISGIMCGLGMFKQVQYIFDEPLNFNVAKGKRITYVGDVYISWKTKGTFKGELMWGGFGMGLIAKDVDGVLKLKVKNNGKKTAKKFRKEYPTKGYKFSKNLINPRTYKTDECKMNCPE